MKVQVQIFKHDDSLDVAAFWKGLHIYCEFFSSLTSQRPRSMAKALQRAKGYIALKKDWRNHMKQIEVLVWQKELIVKVEKLKNVKRISKSTHHLQQGDRSK